MQKQKKENKKHDKDERRTSMVNNNNDNADTNKFPYQKYLTEARKIEIYKLANSKNTIY